MKLKKVTQNDPVERLAVSVKRSTMAMLDAYRAHYLSTYGEEIEKSHLVEEMLREFMQADKDFAKALATVEPAKKLGKPAVAASKAETQS